MSLEIIGLSKHYGKQKAVDNISFSVKEGEILGFLGPNGAGKSTTMKIATCFIPPTAGTVKVNGLDVQQNPLAVRKTIGYLPEHNPLYLEMYVHEYLRFIGSLHGLGGKKLRERVKDVVGLCGLEHEQNKRIQALSKGYRQRVGLAQALVHDPKVLILDEPTTGLDPNQILEIRELIKDISSQKTVVFSTHIMQEVQALCSRVVIINRGNIVADSPVERLREQRGKGRVISVEFERPVDSRLLQQIEGIHQIEQPSNTRYVLYGNEDRGLRSRIFRVAADNDLPLIGLRQEESSLESIFQELTHNPKPSA
ncbi:gliding motility-associated ABC transporter ATP-binding subunit GldA [Nafulsella turpanensis]|uniref:gliding motility-associated ABC transporter ATP-binding subunit GldA n=1 Tax=Nafulsella turpanensis TaxID=1265690 RepID=UPI00034BB2EE|nr:gliding motility-associated ABC transporter ATP-binding subunit GldA [Nafulsella turpanensis]